MKKPRPPYGQACAEKDKRIAELAFPANKGRFLPTVETVLQTKLKQAQEEIERLKVQFDCRTGEAETYGRMLQAKDQEIERLKADLALATNAIHSMSSKHASESNRLTERLTAYKAILEHVFHIHQIGLVWDDCPRCAYEKLKGAL